METDQLIRTLAADNAHRARPVGFVLALAFNHPAVLGAFVLLTGLCISMYFLPARLFVIARPVPGGTEVGLAATTVKGYDVFEDRFRDIVDALRRTEPRSQGTEVTPAPALGTV